MYEFSILDLIFAPIYIMIAFVMARGTQEKNIAENPAYEYYTRGLMVKLFGGVGVCVVYLYYYKGGDTLNYMDDSSLLLRLARTNFSAFWDIWTGTISKARFSVFNNVIGYPVYNHYKIDEWKMIRLTVPFCILGLKLYLPTTILLAWASYQGIWKLYMVFVDRFPDLYKQLAIPILFIPSCAFWGSGILKDTFTFSAVGWYTYSFFMIFIKRQDIRKHILPLIIASMVIINIKSYIFIALLPGSLIWLNFERLQAIKSRFLRFLALPIIMTALGGGGLVIMTQFGGAFGKYSSIDKALETAVVTQKDLKRSDYKGASFDIGDFDPTLSGISKKIPAAINAGLFRPFIWEVRNPVMALSAIENLVFVGLTVWLFFKLGLIGFFRQIGKNPLLIFSLVFALFFAFSVGLTTSNFGSLVRYKIPCEPFYLGTLVALIYSKKSEEEEEQAETVKIKRDKSLSNTGFVVK